MGYHSIVMLTVGMGFRDCLGFRLWAFRLFWVQKFCRVLRVLG